MNQDKVRQLVREAIPHMDGFDPMVMLRLIKDELKEEIKNGSKRIQTS